MCAFQRLRAALGRAFSRTHAAKKRLSNCISIAMLMLAAIGIVCVPCVVTAQTYSYVGAPLIRSMFNSQYCPDVPNITGSLTLGPQCPNGNQYCGTLTAGPVTFPAVFLQNFHVGPGPNGGVLDYWDVSWSRVQGPSKYI